MSKNINIRPLGSRVLVQPLEEDQRSPGGILIPDNAKEKPTWGMVLAVGPGKLLETGKLQPLEIKVNDKVLFGKYSGTEIKHNGKELLVMREEDIMGVMTKKLMI